MQFHVTGIKEGSEGEAEMAKHEGYRNWDAHFHSGSQFNRRFGL